MLIKSPEEMLKFGEKLALESKVLLLEGDLGAGKTLLTKGFAKGLLIDLNMVQSPTYAYINIYNNKLLHIDMYRIEKYEDLIEKGILDQINHFDYVVIERPKFIEKLGLKNYFKINITKKSENERMINIVKHGLT
ncbi:MAG: tRNA (adenosine(37)-N6)-threonylcarbamoyltransferase complex ATPase subunit type 1 TsaE [Candidatus Absconditicoccaceae bacterium]